MADYTLSAKITGDAAEFAKAFKLAEDSASSFKKKMDKFGSNIKSAGKSITDIGNSLTNHITKPAAVAAAALAGITLGKGWSRMSEIDNAKVKLEAIGNSAEDVTEIMNNATASVKGTSYGLNEAATAAASAVAAGIQPGQELQGYLSSIADAAAVAGTDMQSMGAIFNKVATQGKANNEVLQQMAEAGIPIYQYLADTIGCTAEEVFNMASRGEIDLSTFQKSVETHIGGAAQIIGSKTISGAIANIGAAISRIGANFLGSADDASSFAGQVLPLLNEFKDSLGGIEEKAKEWGAVFGQVFSAVVAYCRTGEVSFSDLSGSAAGIVEKLLPIIDTVKNIASAFIGLSPQMQAGLSAGVLLAGPLISTLGKVVSGVGAIFPVIGTVGAAFGNLSTKIQSVGGTGNALKAVFSALGSPIGIVVIAITALVAAFAYLMATNDSFRDSIMNSVGVIANSVAPIFTQLGALLSNIASTVFPVILNVINQLAPVLMQLVEIVAQIFAVLGPIVSTLISSLAPVIEAIVITIMNIVQAVAPALIAIIQMILTVIQTIAPVVMDIISVVAGVIATVISIVTPIISFVGDVISSVMAVISPLVTFVAGIVTTIVQVIGTIIGTVTDIFSTVFTIISTVWSNISNFISVVINAIIAVITTLVGIVGGVFDGIYSVVSSVMGNVQSFISGVFDGIKASWNGLTSFVSGVFSGIGSAVSQLVSQVKGFVNGVIGGINAAIGLINMIPGVSIGRIPYLLHGTDDWQGGFARMNEGGRGELTYLPDGTQVIPHDISVKYAKEAARANSTQATGNEIDYDRLINGIASALTGITVEHVSVLNGKKLSREITPLINMELGRQLEREAMT